MSLEHADFDTWLQVGRDNKRISKPVCDTHDGLPMTKEETDSWNNGEDPCVHALRLYQDASDFESAEGRPEEDNK